MKLITISIIGAKFLFTMSNPLLKNLEKRFY